ncbi:heme peroxidase family protein [Bradyrhizobium sp. YR681]|uniref:peroxidase family protein n=1 Tax=Bradyrhizobium sp. YR681 TaxID=1144344 RepID=UPI0002710D0F|nr:heme peroxidase family protein [Bradyrhizobium sp. YR681]EJN12434.1 heme peroxidase family protein [Bradyrhizobium sp. YR681]
MQDITKQNIAQSSAQAETLLGKQAEEAKAKRPQGHGRSERGLDAVAYQPEGFGRFGRMFPELARARFGDTLPQEQQVMNAIAATMIKTGDLGAPIDKAEPVDEQPKTKAGYTYFGQFIDHDITFDPASDLDRDNDPGATEDFRTARLDLDSVYGRGPADQPYLYNPNLTLKLGVDRTPAYLKGKKKLFDVLRAPLDESGEVADADQDCPRAMIGDKRNDENNIVVQIHQLWQRFHNRIMLDLARPSDAAGNERPGITGLAAFNTAQRSVRWHYQWVVLHDFVRRMVGDHTFHAVYNGGKPKLHFYKPEVARYPFMPVEFSVAAYRFGHSMVRPSYSLSAEIPHQKTNLLDRLSIFKPKFSCDDVRSLNGFRPLPEDWGIDWSFFLPDVKSELPAPTKELPFDKFVRPQPAYRIDTMLVDPLSDLPDLRNEKRPDRRSLPGLNLQRGIALGLPSGQAVARRMGITPLTDQQLWLDAGNLTDADAVKARQDVFTTYAAQLHENAPLWYYILREAELTEPVETKFGDDDKNERSQPLGGARLGAVGGRIVAEVLIGLVLADSQSYLIQFPDWRPTVKDMSDPKTKFELSDVVNYVDS